MRVVNNSAPGAGPDHRFGQNLRERIRRSLWSEVPGAESWSMSAKALRGDPGAESVEIWAKIVADHTFGGDSAPRKVSGSSTRWWYTGSSEGWSLWALSHWPKKWPILPTNGPYGNTFYKSGCSIFRRRKTLKSPFGRFFQKGSALLFRIFSVRVGAKSRVCHF